MNDKTKLPDGHPVVQPPEYSEKEWNDKRTELEDAAKDAALALLAHTKSRACCIPFAHDGFAMVVSVGLPVDVIATTAEAMKMFMRKHEDDMDALAVLAGAQTKFKNEEEEPPDATH